MVIIQRNAQIRNHIGRSRNTILAGCHLLRCVWWNMIVDDYFMWTC